MARGDSPPFARGETYANGNAYILDANNPLNASGFGGINIQGKEFVFEPNSADAETGYPLGVNDPAGRPIRVKVVRNTSGINLLPGRLVHYSTSDPNGYEVSVDGYCFEASDRPAGIVDEFLPPAGVVPNDLFYIVTEGPTLVTQPATPITTVVESRLVPAATGTTYPVTGGPATGRVDPAAGRVALQDTTQTGAALFAQIQNQVGFAAAANSTANAQFGAVIRMGGVA